MFTYTIDKKPYVTDPNGNEIVDFVTPLFSKKSQGVKDYLIRRVDSGKYIMRPDLISMAMYGDINYAEYILKFSGISNPFTLCETDVLKIPNDTEVYGILEANQEKETNNTAAQEEQIRKIFKYYDKETSPYKKYHNGKQYEQLQNIDKTDAIIDTGKI